MERICFFCHTTSDKLEICAECENIYSCPKHLKIHKPGEQCLPFKVVIKKDIGRCVVATKNILAGEIVLEDKSAMVGPACTERVCLECLDPISADEKCTECQLPLCCKADKHTKECPVLKEWKQDESTNLSLYMAVGILRGLSVDDETKAKVDLLMDHLDMRLLAAW